MKPGYRYVVSSIVVMILLLVDTAVISYGEAAAPSLARYLELKKKGLYHEALLALKEKVALEHDRLTLLADLFRIQEVLRYPELRKEALALYDELEKKRDIASDPDLYRTTRYFKMDLLLSEGAFDAAARLRQQLGFITEYEAYPTLPFKGDDEYDAIVRQGQTEKTREKGAYRVNADRQGKLDLADFLGQRKAQVFIARARFNIEAQGSYTLYLGKTGYCDLYVDGTHLFTSKRQHDYFPGQYAVTLELAPGRHTLRVMTATDDDGACTFSLQLVDSRGHALKHAARGNKPQEERTPAAAGQTEKISYRSSEVYNPEIPAAQLSDATRFAKGYLLFQSGFRDKDQQAVAILREIAPAAPLGSQALYYRAMAEHAPARKEQLLLTALKQDPANIEIMRLLALLKLDHGFSEQAMSYIQACQKQAPFSNLTRELTIYQYLHLQWYAQLKRMLKQLDRETYPSLETQAYAGLYTRLEKHGLLSGYLEKMAASDYYNETYADNILETAGRVYDMEKRLSLAYNYMHVFPTKIKYKLYAAACYQGMEQYQAALTLLFAARKYAPYNAAVLFSIGECYHYMQKREQARYYMQQALYYAPEERFYREYRNLLYGTEENLEQYLARFDLKELTRAADAFKTEPAVALQDETVIKVFHDGSYLKRVRRVYQVYEPENIEELKKQYIVLDKETDRLLSLHCRIVRGEEERECQTVYVQSLSDPQSKLYYDLIAYTIEMPKLYTNDSIVLDYLVHSTRGKELRGYYGERISFPDSFRTMRGRVTLLTPEKKPMKWKVYHTKQKKVEVKRQNGTIVYHYTVKNLPPVKKEINMQPGFDRVPSVVFTSLQSWDEFFDWYRTLLTPQLVLDNEMEEQMRKLVEGAPDDLEKVKRVYRYITERVRYVGFEMGVGSIKPRRADATYYSRLGDCKDIATLLMVIYRSLGIPSRLVLIRTVDSGTADMSLPYIGNFNHAICYVAVGDEGIYLDGTVNRAGIFELPSADRDTTVLLIDEHGYDTRHVDPAAYMPNVDEVVTAVAIENDGTAYLQRKLVKHGTVALEARNQVVDKKKKFRQLVSYWNSRYPGAQLSDYQVLEERPGEPFSYQYTIIIPDFIVASDGEIVLPSMLTPSHYYKHFAPTRERENRLVIFSSQDTIERTVYMLPAEFEIMEIPDNASYTYKGNHSIFAFKIDQATHSVIVENRTTFARSMLTAKEYQAFKEFLLRITEKEAAHILLKRKQQ